MTVSTVIALLGAVFGTSGLTAVVTAVVNSRRDKSQSETEARAQFTKEFEAVVAAMAIQYERLDKEVDELKSQVGRIRSDHQKAEDYIDLLIAGITNGTIPPVPDRK